MKKHPNGTPAPDALPYTRNDIPQGGSLGTLRAAAWEAYRSLPFPSKKEDAWRRMDWRGFPRELPLAQPSAAPASVPARFAEDPAAGTLLLYTGGAERTLAPELDAQGIRFCDIRAAEREISDLVERFAGKLLSPQEGKFAALASALAEDGALLYIPKGIRVEAPLHLLRWAEERGAHFSRLLIILEAGASATLLAETASPNGIGSALHAGVTEIFLGEGASLRFVELQTLGEEMWHIAHERVRVERDAAISWVIGSLGARTAKNFLTLELSGEGAEGNISGFYFAEDNQFLDHDTRQEHLAPHTKSDLLFKGALAGKSRSVWRGMVYVAPNAQKTDGYQSAHTLLLSEDARADSIPGLEILADDVRCSHGATVGKVEEEILFYLTTRGIPRADAERLAVEGFFEPILQRIPSENVRHRFHAALMEKLAARDSHRNIKEVL